MTRNSALFTAQLKSGLFVRSEMNERNGTLLVFFFLIHISNRDNEIVYSLKRMFD